MKAYLITPENSSIESIEVSCLDDIKSVIGFDTLESDEIGADGDRLYFDEECFLRGSIGRFQIDKLIPVSGKGVIVAADDDETTLLDVIVSLDELNQRIKFLQLTDQITSYSLIIVECSIFIGMIRWKGLAK